MTPYIYYIEETRCHKDWFWNNKSNYATKAWTGFHLWYVLSGKGQIKQGDSLYQIQTGDTFLFDLNLEHDCSHEPNQPLCVIALHFECNFIWSGSVLFTHNLFLGHLVQRCLDARKRRNAPGLQIWFRAVIEEILTLKKPAPTVSPVIQNVMQYLTANCCINLNLTHVAANFSYTPNHLTKRFKQETGITPIQYIILQRTELAKNMLLYSKKNILEISTELGYSDQSHFSRQFKRIVGVSPSLYKEGYRRQIQK